MPNGDVFPCHVQTQPEFRCGNLREQELLEICRRAGLLGQLQALDFRELAGRDRRLAPLGERPVCMGTVYAETRSLPVWAESLPMQPTAARHSGR